MASCIDLSAHHDVRDISEIKGIALDLMEVHGLIGKGWAFDTDKATRRAGCCDFSRKKISISATFGQKVSIDELTDSVLHEIAHALAGKQHNHDSMWQQTAKDIGCKALRCHKIKFSRSKYTLTCQNGCFKQERMKRPSQKMLQNNRCKKCKAKAIFY